MEQSFSQVLRFHKAVEVLTLRYRTLVLPESCRYLVTTGFGQNLDETVYSALYDSERYRVSSAILYIDAMIISDAGTLTLQDHWGSVWNVTSLTRSRHLVCFISVKKLASPVERYKAIWTEASLAHYLWSVSTSN